MKFLNKGNEYFIDEGFLQWLHKEWKGYIIVVGGPSGVGKTTISEKLGYEFVPAVTTRERRKTYETYDFTTHQEYNEMYREKAFATGVRYGQRDKYGVSIERFKEAAAHNDVLIITMSPIGYRLLKTRYARTIGVFVSADFNEVRKRLLKRDGFLDTVRVQSYENNMRSKGFYHIKISNNRRITMGLKILKVRFLVKVIRQLDKSKRGQKIRKKWFAVLKDNVFKKQTKERARKRKKRLLENQIRQELSKKVAIRQTLAELDNVVGEISSNTGVNEASAAARPETSKVAGGK